MLTDPFQYISPRWGNSEAYMFQNPPKILPLEQRQNMQIILNTKCISINRFQYHTELTIL
jgi:hypothetical protein